MTQPVQEPSDQRQISGVEYRTRQLARRPALTAASSAIFEYATVTGTNDTVTVPNTTWTAIPGANLFGSCMVVGPGEYLEVQEVSTNEFTLKILQPCYCLVSVSIDWTTDFQAQKAAQLLPTGIWYPTGQTGPIFALPYLGTHAHFGSPMEVAWGGGGSQTITLNVWQNSGVSKSVDGSTGIGIAVISNLPDPVFC